MLSRQEKTVQQTFLARVVLPASLFIIMLGMGLSLTVADFKRVLQLPKAVGVGIICQMVMLPLVGLLVVKLMPMATPALAVGLVVLTLCPGGTTSNMLTYLARGDVALSITLTAIVSAVTPFTIPLFTAYAMQELMGQTEAIHMPLGKTIQFLLFITVIPVGVGMLINRRWPALASKAEKPVKIMSLVILAAIIAGLVKQNADKLPTYFAQTGGAALVLNVITMTLGFFIARLARLPHKQQVTVGMEVGIQNGTTALLVTGTLLGVPEMTIAPAIYSLIMFATGGLFGVIVNRLAPADNHEEQAEPEEA